MQDEYGPNGMDYSDVNLVLDDPTKLKRLQSPYKYISNDLKSKQYSNLVKLKLED